MENIKIQESAKPKKRGCCRTLFDIIIGFIQFIFYCIIFPALVMVGPVGLVYFLFQCYVENDVSNAVVETSSIFLCQYAINDMVYMSVKLTTH
jgi:hypothetical protein